MAPPRFGLAILPNPCQDKNAKFSFHQLTPQPIDQSTRPLPAACFLPFPLVPLSPCPLVSVSLRSACCQLLPASCRLALRRLPGLWCSPLPPGPRIGYNPGTSQAGGSVQPVSSGGPP